MNKSKKSDLSQRVDLGIRRGIARALMEHKKAGRSIVILRDGHIVRIPPEEIQIDEKFIQDKK